MKLIPSVASYGGRGDAIRDFLNKEALDVVARVAVSPVCKTELHDDICDELIEMHALVEKEGLVRLSTCVFLEEDIRMVNTASIAFARELTELLMHAIERMREELPVVTNFIVGIIGIGQSLGQTLREKAIAEDWKSYTGNYAQSKVDFNEMCTAYTELGEDLQNKTVLRGSQFTAIFIGPGGRSFLIPGGPGHDSYDTTRYIWTLNQFLTDAYAMLIAGDLESEALRSAAQQVGLFRNGNLDTVVLTDQSMERFLPIIQQISDITTTCFIDKLNYFRELLGRTTSGRHGVPPANMMMNLWRYIRRAVAREMYTRAIFTDKVPETGLITIFCENDVKILKQLLG